MQCHANMRMIKFHISLLLSFFSIWGVDAQKTNIAGKVYIYNTKTPIEFALVSAPEQGLWATSNEKGEFILRKAAEGKISLTISSLGFVSQTVEVNIEKGNSPFDFYLKRDNLLLEEVTVTAQKKSNELATTYLIDRQAMNNLQAISLADILSLLPGKQTNGVKSLISEQRISLHSQSNTELDNPSFGTAIEVDGVRLSNNATYNTSSSDGVEGVGTRNIAVSNIESIEVITGVPSVEHGDLNSGMIRINTKKGKSPLEIEAVIKPLIKSYSLNKGFDLRKHAGTLNAFWEYSRSIGNRTSPYTTYVRNSLGLNYQTTLGREKRPLRLTAGLNINTGGYNSESDPDYFTDTYTKQKDHTVRGNIGLKWLLNQPWITGLEILSSINYADRRYENQTNMSSSSSVTSIHTTESGYHIATDQDTEQDAPIYLIPSGYWYQLMYNDDKPVSFSLEWKSTWNRKIANASSFFKLGGEFTSSGNYGKGISYADRRYAPTYREFRYDKQPFVKTMALYAEERMMFPVFEKSMELQLGIRSDINSIRGSEYGTVSSFSPRFNSKYTVIDKSEGIVKRMMLHWGYGDAVKLPSAKILFPQPSYSDRLVFASPTMSDGTSFAAYHTMVQTPIYNSGLKWQRNRKMELGMDLHLDFVKLSLNLFSDKIMNPYKTANTFTPFSYKQTSISALADCLIPETNRVYSIDQTTGIITVSDKTGEYANQQLAYTEKKMFKSGSYYGNGSTVQKRGIEWMADFATIRSLKTSFRLDGNYFYYKGLEETIEQYSPSTTTMSDGNYYKYIGYYVGGNQSANGKITKKLTSNLTVTTHIPAIRLIVSVRMEACFYDMAQNLSEYSKSARSFVLDSRSDYTPSSTQSDIYAGDQFVGLYPLYYTSMDDMNTKIPFAEKLLWAKDNDKALYNDLSSLVVKSNYNYIFNRARYSSYFSSNISVTKEIGNMISITFQANNFINSMQKITNSQTGNQTSVYLSGKIPEFYYGLTCRIKL